MGHDKLSIISMNSARRGLSTLPGNERSSYLERILDSASPDICFLPGDDKALKMNLVIGYKQYNVPSADGTVLLYDTKRIAVEAPQFNPCSFGQLPGLDYDQMVCPSVKVFSDQPGKGERVVKEFNLITWKYSLFVENKVGPERMSESLVRFSQKVALSTQKPVLIGGEMRIDQQMLQQIVNKLCKEGDQMFLNGVEENLDMKERGYLPSMTKASFRPVRHLFMMKVFRCSTGPLNRSAHQSVVQTWDSGFVPDCFIASKELELTEASLLDLDNVTGRHIKLETKPAPKKAKQQQKTKERIGDYCPTQTSYVAPQTVFPPQTRERMRDYCPTQTSVTIPARPPRHHGG